MIANTMAMPGTSDTVEEIPLLLPSWQIVALAEAAAFEGVTVAQYLRRLVNKALGFPTFAGKSLHSA